jgi:hypothetical protein
MAGDRHIAVTRQGDQRGLAVTGRDVDQNDRVGALAQDILGGASAELFLLLGREPLAAVGAHQNVVIPLGRCRAGSHRTGIDVVHVAPRVERDPDHEREPCRYQQPHTHENPATTVAAAGPESLWIR